jgi:DNA (cytosine-5)-methyltransferase 1
VKTAGLFAGIGGFEVGLAESGHEAVFLCEIANPARAVLNEHFGGVACHPDITELRDLPLDVELLVAGFPCQDLSQAGMTAGITGERSGLVQHVFRLLDRHRTPWIVLENVSFMLHLGRGKALRVITEALEERGYRWAYRIVNSLAFVPQRRERFFLAATTTETDPADVILVDEATPPETRIALDSHAHGFYWTEGTRGLGWAADAVPTLKNGSTVGIPAPPAILMPDGRVMTPDVRDAERLQGFPEDWTKPAETVAKKSARWSLVGSAVTVPVARWLGRRLSEPGLYDRSRDRNLPVTPRSPLAARFDGKRRWSVEISTFPIWAEREPLASFLRHDGNLLSARATRGFLARADSSSLRFVEGFKDRVRAHLRHMESSSSDTARISDIVRLTSGSWHEAAKADRSEAERPDVSGPAAGDRRGIGRRGGAASAGDGLSTERHISSRITRFCES